MRYQMPANKTKRQNGLKIQIIVCLIALVILSGIKLTQQNTLQKTKQAVRHIVTHQTDLSEIIKKGKNIFTSNEEIQAMKPISEFTNPAPKGKITTGFGVQNASNSDFHYGVDIKIPDGENVLAVADGKISEIATTQELGTYIVIKHSEEILTVYSKLNEILPSVGEKVESGQIIARANQEDNTIHFEIKRGETYLNPEEFIDFGKK